MNKGDFLAYVVDCHAIVNVLPFKVFIWHPLLRKERYIRVQLSRTCSHLYKLIYKRYGVKDMQDFVKFSLYNVSDISVVFTYALDTCYILIFEQPILDEIECIVENKRFGNYMIADTVFQACGTTIRFTINKNTVHRSDTNMTISLSEFMIPYIQSWRQ
jgi:hypothetical protein